MAYRLEDLAERLNARLIGDPSVLIEGIGSLGRAIPGQIVHLRDPRHCHQLHDIRASALLVGTDGRDLSALPRLVCEASDTAFAVLTRIFHPLPQPDAGVHPSAVIGGGCRIGDRTSIAAGVAIGANVTVGNDCVIGPNCTLGDHCTLGDRCRLVASVVLDHAAQLGSDVLVHPGAVIGSDGFGFADDQGKWLKIFHSGRVVIGDEVEIGANTTIDRGTIDDTVIEAGVKIDDQVHIAHNVRIGTYTAIAACTGIAGSTTIGCHCRIGGAAGISDHLNIADNVTIGAMATVLKSILKAGVYTSPPPLQQYREWRRNSTRIRQLDSIARRLKRLEDTAEDHKEPPRA